MVCISIFIERNQFIKVLSVYSIFAINLSLSDILVFIHSSTGPNSYQPIHAWCTEIAICIWVVQKTLLIPCLQVPALTISKNPCPTSSASAFYCSVLVSTARTHSAHGGLLGYTGKCAPQRSPQPKINKKLCANINTPVPLLLGGANAEVHVPHWFPECHSGMKLQMPIAVACLRKYYSLAPLPSCLILSLPCKCTLESSAN